MLIIQQLFCICTELENEKSLMNGYYTIWMIYLFILFIYSFLKIILMKSALCCFYTIKPIHFLILLWHATKNGLYLAINLYFIQWLDQGEEPKHFPKPKLHQKKAMVTAWWSISEVLHYIFLNLLKTIISEKHFQKINKMLQKLLCLHRIWINQKFSVTASNSISLKWL